MPAITKVQFRPGIVKETTQFANTGGWYDCNFMRFRAGFPETIGGWVAAEPTAVIGVPRSLHQWSSLAGSQSIGIGTSHKYYILNSDVFYDVTPQRTPIACPTDPFTTITNPLQLEVTVPSHGCQVGDYVTFTGATSGVGNYTTTDLNCPTGQNDPPVQFQVFSVVDASTLILTGTKAAGASGQVGGGAAVMCVPDGNAGLSDRVTTGGYGYGPYSGYYGASDSRNFGWGMSPSAPVLTLTPSSASNQPRVWHHDNFGQDLLINPRGGPIYYWTANTGSPTAGLQKRAISLQAAAVIWAAANSVSVDSNIPSNSNGVFVSPISQVVVAVGCTPYGSTSGVADPMQIRWSDILNPYIWSPNRTNAAGGMRLSSGSFIVGFLPTFSQTLIWTDTTLYSMNYTGNSYVFSFQVLANGVSLMGPNAAVSNGSTTFWMDSNSFRMFNGSVQELPCSVKQFVFSRINRAQAWKSFAAHNHNFSEVWFFYPVGQDIDSYAIYNYLDGTWSVGSLNRTAWLDSGQFATPLAADSNGMLYWHETGTDNNGVALTPYIESADMSIGDGDMFAFAQKIIPDITFTGTATAPLTSLDLMWRNSGNDAKFVQRSLTITPTTEYLYGRIRGRRLSVRFYSSVLGSGWRLGNTEVEMMPNGRR